MADIEWPADLLPSPPMQFYLQPHIRMHQSPLTKDVTVHELSPPRWTVRLAMQGSGARAGRIEALIALLRGGARSVSLFDWRRRTGNGVVISHDDWAAQLPTFFFDDETGFDDDSGFIVEGDGEPRNLAATRGADQVVLRGFQPYSVPRRMGDYVGFGDERCYMVTADAAADVDGKVTVAIMPPLHASVAAGSLEMTDVRARFRLTSAEPGANPTERSGRSTYQLVLTEDLL